MRFWFGLAIQAVGGAFLLFFMYQEAHAEQLDCQHKATTFKCVTYLKNYDADTVTFKIPNVHPMLGYKISIRVRGIDTPEIRGKTDCEKAAAKKAKEFVRLELVGARLIELHAVGRGKYFRLVANILYDGKNLTEELFKKGYGYPYEGGTKEVIDWCQTPTERVIEKAMRGKK